MSKFHTKSHKRKENKGQNVVTDNEVMLERRAYKTGKTCKPNTLNEPKEIKKNDKHMK